MYFIKPRISTLPQAIYVQYPEHELKTNGISYFSKEATLFATHRRTYKGGKCIMFGLTNFLYPDSKHANLVIYMSERGNHKDISACRNHAEEFDSNDLMTVYFKDEEQTQKQIVEGFEGINCPVVDEIKKDNNTTYKIRFNCYSSCFKKDLTIHFVAYVDGKEVWSQTQPIKITANPGRDSGVRPASVSQKKRKRKHSDFTFSASRYPADITDQEKQQLDDEMERSCMSIRNKFLAERNSYVVTQATKALFTKLLYITYFYGF